MERNHQYSAHHLDGSLVSARFQCRLMVGYGASGFVSGASYLLLQMLQLLQLFYALCIFPDYARGFGLTCGGATPWDNEGQTDKLPTPQSSFYLLILTTLISFSLPGVSHEAKGIGISYATAANGFYTVFQGLTVSKVLHTGWIGKGNLATAYVLRT